MRPRSGAAIQPGTILGCLGLLALLLLAPPARAQFLVAPQYTFAQGGIEAGVGVVAADLNHDGKMDLVFSPGGNLYATVALGNGDGTFQTPVSYLTGGFWYPDAVTVADFNGDGNPDIAVVSSGGVLSILLGNGDGTFQPYRAYAAPVLLSPTFSFYMAVGDLNGDGFPDLVIASAYNYQQAVPLTVLMNNGDGSFAPGVNYPAPMGPVAVGDFNGDGKPDIVVTSGGTVAPQNNIGVLLNNGNGTFAPVVYSPLSGGSTGVVIGDFNGDGRLDVAAWIPDQSQEYVGSSPGSATILLGNGDGTFQPGGHYPATFGGGITIGDFNGDGRWDLAVTGSNGRGVDAVLRPSPTPA